MCSILRAPESLLLEGRGKGVKAGMQNTLKRSGFTKQSDNLQVVLLEIFFSGGIDVYLPLDVPAPH